MNVFSFLLRSVDRSVAEFKLLQQNVVGNKYHIGIIGSKLGLKWMP
jgi:hypothetical protein